LSCAWKGRDDHERTAHERGYVLARQHATFDVERETFGDVLKGTSGMDEAFFSRGGRKQEPVLFS